MARPPKGGVDYWPLDVGFFRDKKLKLIRAEFGVKGAYIALEIMNSVYENNGYYKAWDNDDCLLMSEGVGDGCSPELVSEVLNGCLRRSIFNEGVFKMFGVITSAGIQRRYLRIVGVNRLEIPIIKEYWLLNVDDKNDVPSGILQKVSFQIINHMENPSKSMENPSKSMENSQSKVKESKVKESKVSCVPAELEKVFKAYAVMRNKLKKPMTDDAIILVIEKLEKLAHGDYETQKAILNQSIMNSWQGVFPLKDKVELETGKEKVYKEF